MALIQKSKVLPVEQYYLTHLNIINDFLPYKMTETERKILSAFLSLPEEITEDDMFNTLARKKVKESLGGMTASALSNHIKTLINKEYLSRHPITNKISIASYIIPDKYMQGYQFKLTVE